MEIREAQREVRSVYLNGSVGQAVSGIIWLASAGLSTWVSTRYGIIALAAGGAFIFLLTQLILKLMGRPASLRRENPFSQLAMQTAFIIPLSLPVIGAAALYNLNWFYPAFMIVVGTHYMPFMTLYGMWQYGILAAALIGGGVLIGMYLPESFAIGGWFTGIVLVLFAIVAWLITARKSSPQAA
ncbi:MAG TPA: hypothetical protein VFF68_14145 [Anaerolineaceae bacterium]|nr:hypothetical protein [Anaerolineaceae bacterium]